MLEDLPGGDAARRPAVPTSALPAKFAAVGLTYDDVLLLPGDSAYLVPAEIDTTAG